MTNPIILAQAQTEPAAKPETAEAIIEDVSSGIAPVVQFVVETTQSLIKQFFSYEGLYQLTTIIVSGLLVWFIAGRIRLFITHIWPEAKDESGFLKNARIVLLRLAFPALWVVSLWIATTTFRSMFLPNDLIRVVASMLQAWVLIRLFSTFVRDPFWSRAFAAVAWFIAALNILRLLNPTIALLDSMSLSVGEDRLSLYMVIKGVAALTLLIWVASFVSRLVQSQVNRQENLTPSVRSLISQAIRIIFLFAAVMLAMNTIGFDLTAFAVFSGAIGVGIGFGLQAIFSNLVAGIILLLEQSIKVGDFVELESGLTGEVREINTRSARITTNDNVDILVPNSEFINNRVTNWTLRDNYKRARIPFGVAYGTDKEVVRKAALEAAESVPHMLQGTGARPPEVWLVSFGESSLDFELVVWIKPDSVKRPGVVNADYNWALETALGKYGIEIPFPQRDLHIRSGELPIKLAEEVKTNISKDALAAS
ncbi:MAG: mechanosensitive ion channel [Fimbriimonadaceae bacterium]|nr:mechanosensitive ion channel [Alphaproteobacteria bacterium]